MLGEDHLALSIRTSITSEDLVELCAGRCGRCGRYGGGDCGG